LRGYREHDVELAHARRYREAKFADVIERALYNGIIRDVTGRTLYCYRNPLAFDPSGGDKIRDDWYDTTCCPPNLERTFASLPGISIAPAARAFISTSSTIRNSTGTSKTASV